MSSIAIDDSAYPDGCVPLRRLSRSKSAIGIYSAPGIFGMSSGVILHAFVIVSAYFAVARGFAVRVMLHRCA